MKLNVYVLEKNNNKDICAYISCKYNLLSDIKWYEADVVIVNRVYNVEKALNIIDNLLIMGKEVICIKNKFAKEHYVCNYLIKNGAIYI